MEETLQTRQEPSKPRRVSPAVRSVMEWVETIVMAVVLVAVAFTFVARVITVDGVSMEPTYYNGDRVLVTKLAGQARQGDVVIVVGALEEPIIKRVVATEGQTVDFDPELGEVTVDGQPLPGSVFGIKDGITFVPDLPGMVMEFPQTVPEGCVFVLGDNRDNSTDSRFVTVGMVDQRNILGKVVFSLYPFSKIGFV
ncbi:MAG: signal peptidase I [Acutalibacter sp.]